MMKGSTFETAIVINKKELNRPATKLENEFLMVDTPLDYATLAVFEKYIEKMFGRNDGDYFILNQYEARRKGELFVCFFIEQKNGTKHNIYFRIED